jgi:16S rRNA (adenine1518-N6/adenine1519-N6)-dimethyltransferase
VIEPDRQTSLATPNPVERIPVSRRDWTRLMTELGIRPNKGLGQHFLFERGIVERMVRQAGVSRDETVLEVGPGLGILTSELLRKAGSVVAVELDRSLAAHLRRAFGDLPGFQLVEGNALTTPIDEIIPPDEPYDVVANLPYSVGSAILRSLLEQRRKPRRLTVMLQKEVAERLVAAPPEMSILGVATQFYAVPRLAFTVAPEVFIPPPKVESAVVILEVREEPLLPAEMEPLFFKIVTAGFRQKRKQVANSIADVLRLPKAEIAAWLVETNVDPMRRAETLTVEEWVALAKSAPAAVVAA